MWLTRTDLAASSNWEGSWSETAAGILLARLTLALVHKQVMKTVLMSHCDALESRRTCEGRELRPQPAGHQTSAQKMCFSKTMKTQGIVLWIYVCVCVCARTHTGEEKRTGLQLRGAGRNELKEQISSMRWVLLYFMRETGKHERTEVKKKTSTDNNLMLFDAVHF